MVVGVLSALNVFMKYNMTPYVKNKMISVLWIRDRLLPSVFIKIISASLKSGFVNSKQTCTPIKVQSSSLNCWNLCFWRSSRWIFALIALMLYFPIGASKIILWKWSSRQKKTVTLSLWLLRLLFVNFCFLAYWSYNNLR